MTHNLRTKVEAGKGNNASVHFCPFITKNTGSSCRVKISPEVMEFIFSFFVYS